MRITKSTFSVQLPLRSVAFLAVTSLQVIKIRNGGWYTVLQEGYRFTKEDHVVTGKVQRKVTYINWSIASTNSLLANALVACRIPATNLRVTNHQ